MIKKFLPLALVLAAVLSATAASIQQMNTSVTVGGFCRGTCSATVHCAGTCFCNLDGSAAGFCTQDPIGLR